MAVASLVAMSKATNALSSKLGDMRKGDGSKVIKGGQDGSDHGTTKGKVGSKDDSPMLLGARSIDSKDSTRRGAREAEVASPDISARKTASPLPEQPKSPAGGASQPLLLPGAVEETSTPPQ